MNKIAFMDGYRMQKTAGFWGGLMDILKAKQLRKGIKTLGEGMRHNRLNKAIDFDALSKKTLYSPDILRELYKGSGVKRSTVGNKDYWLRHYFNDILDIPFEDVTKGATRDALLPELRNIVRNSGGADVNATAIGPKGGVLSPEAAAELMGQGGADIGKGAAKTVAAYGVPTLAIGGGTTALLSNRGQE